MKRMGAFGRALLNYQEFSRRQSCGVSNGESLGRRKTRPLLLLGRVTGSGLGPLSVGARKRSFPSVSPRKQSPEKPPSEILCSWNSPSVAVSFNGNSSRRGSAGEAGRPAQPRSSAVKIDKTQNPVMGRQLMGEDALDKACVVLCGSFINPGVDRCASRRKTTSHEQDHPDLSDSLS